MCCAPRSATITRGLRYRSGAVMIYNVQGENVSAWSVGPECGEIQVHTILPDRCTPCACACACAVVRAMLTWMGD